MASFALVWYLVIRHSSQIWGEMSMDQLANRKQLNKISGIFSIRLKCDSRNLEADVTSCVNGVTRIDFL